MKRSILLEPARSTIMVWLATVAPACPLEVTQPIYTSSGNPGVFVVYKSPSEREKKTLAAFRLLRACERATRSDSREGLRGAKNKTPTRRRD